MLREEAHSGRGHETRRPWPCGSLSRGRSQGSGHTRCSFRQQPRKPLTKGATGAETGTPWARGHQAAHSGHTGAAEHRSAPALYVRAMLSGSSDWTCRAQHPAGAGRHKPWARRSWRRDGYGASTAAPPSQGRGHGDGSTVLTFKTISSEGKGEEACPRFVSGETE